MRLLLRRQSRTRKWDRRYAPYELRHKGARVGLNHTQGLYVLAFFCHGAVKRIDLTEIRWPDPDAMPDWWMGCLRTEIYRLNKILAGVDAQIICHAGYYKLLELEALEVAA
jgi:hypothetical protein